MLLTLLLTFLAIQSSTSSDQPSAVAPAFAKPCKRSANQCCLYVKEHIQHKWPSHLGASMPLYAADVATYGDNGLIFHCCVIEDFEFSFSLGEEHAEISCEGPFSMQCPKGRFLLIVPERFEYKAPLGNPQKVRNTVGFCQKLGTTRRILVHGGSTGRLDIPVLIKGDPDDHVFIWFTDTSPQEKLVYVVWARIVDRHGGWIEKKVGKTWYINWGPLHNHSAYQVVIQTLFLRETVIHVRMGQKDDFH